MSLAREESQLNVGGYWHFFPKHSQARRAIWNGVDPKLGLNFIDAAFGGLIEHRNSSDMFLELKGGSTWQLLGSDNYDRLVGGNARGAVFSEWALCDPRALDYIKPIIVENHGWIIFITTYRGRNHAWKMVKQLRADPEWYVDIRTVEDTRDIHGKRIITDADIARERADGVSEAMIQQEYFCNPAAAVPGAVYAAQAERLVGDTARVSAPWNPLAPVYACWSFQQAPVCSGVVFVQPGVRPRILAAELFPFLSVPEALAKSRERPWKVSEHLVRESESAVLDALSGLRVYPDVIRNELLLPGRAETLAQAFLETATINAAESEDLVDSLTAYTRRDLTMDEAHPYFASGFEATWHGQLAQAVELAAVYEDITDAGWQRPQSYRNFDRRAI